MSDRDPIPLLRELVRRKSISGREEPVLDFLDAWFDDQEIPSRVDGRNIIVERGSGPTLLFNAHIDTVPDGPGWTRDPWNPRIEGDRLFGLGSNDNKASAAAMVMAFATLIEEGLPGGRLVLALTCDEETGGQGMEYLRPRLGRIDQALLSEPTNFGTAIAQRGLVRLAARATGRAAHASRPWEGQNAIDLALEDIARLKAIDLSGEHPILGRATLEITLIEGGSGANVIPGECEFTLDGRPTPDHDNEKYDAEIRDALVHSDIVALKGRMTPVVTPKDSALVRACLAVTEREEPVAMGGVSDLFFVRDLPAAVLGPGTHDQSHQPDESVSVEATRKAVGIYTEIARRVLTEIAT